MTYMTLYDIEAGVKVKFDMWKRFADHNIQEAVFLFQTLKTNNKGMLGVFDMAQYSSQNYQSAMVARTNYKGDVMSLYHYDAT